MLVKEGLLICYWINKQSIDYIININKINIQINYTYNTINNRYSISLNSRVAHIVPKDSSTFVVARISNLSIA